MADGSPCRSSMPETRWYSSAPQRSACGGRGGLASWLGSASDPGDATRLSPGLPKVGFVAPPATYQSSIGERIPAESMDLVGRLMSMQTAHRSYMVTGAICNAAAAVAEGTLVHEVTRKTATDTPT